MGIYKNSALTQFTLTAINTKRTYLAPFRPRLHVPRIKTIARQAQQSDSAADQLHTAEPDCQEEQRCLPSGAPTCDPRRRHPHTPSPSVVSLRWAPSRFAAGRGQSGRVRSSYPPRPADRRRSCFSSTARRVGGQGVWRCDRRWIYSGGMMRLRMESGCARAAGSSRSCWVLVVAEADLVARRDE